ncbi:MAG TPA: alpha/beta fold hydrolase [Solirubrobacteraceae bacterium]|nr:alpha/beta fold hydrolase [Solirubrobacteraceae bacterium]
MSQLRERVVEFTAGDGLKCDVINVRAEQAPAKGPVLLVHGAGVRANIFRAPSGRNLVEMLVEQGWDVWLENWRASIEIPHNHWTLDQAAVHDHPHAVRMVCEQTGAEQIQAVIHCQGSTSFMMSALAGLVPQVRTIVSNAVSIHPVVPWLANLKLRSMIPATARVLGYLDPQWGRVGAPWIVPKLVDAWIKLDHHECDNSVCKWSSYTYGAAKPTLWRHENLNEATHEWLRGEFAAVPLTFFSQILRCVRARRLLAVEDHPQLPRDFTAQAPQTDARVVFIAGALNRCFTAESQRLSHAWYSKHAPQRTALHIFDGYGHLDMFMGERAARDVFPTILAELEAGA